MTRYERSLHRYRHIKILRQWGKTWREIGAMLGIKKDSVKGFFSDWQGRTGER